MPAAAPVEPTSRLRVVMGEEELLRARAVSAVRAAVLARDAETEVHDLQAAGLPVGELADVLAPSLFGGHRLVVVSGVHEAAGALADALVGYTKDPDPDLTLVIVHFGGKRNEALVKAFKSAGAAVDECPKLKWPRELADFVRNEVRTFGGRIAPDAVAALVEAIGADLRQLSSAASQLVSDYGGSVDADAVAAFHRGRAEANGFAVSDKVMVGDLTGSVDVLRWALSGGVAPVLIADAISEGIRTAARAKSVNLSSYGDLMRAFKWPKWKAEKGLNHARGWSIEGLQKAIGVAADLNADVKGAAAHVDYALEQAVRRIVAIRAETSRDSRARARY